MGQYYFFGTDYHAGIQLLYISSLFISHPFQMNKKISYSILYTLNPYHNRLNHFSTSRQYITLYYIMTLWQLQHLLLVYILYLCIAFDTTEKVLLYNNIIMYEALTRV